MAKKNTVENKLARLHEVGLFEHITMKAVKAGKDGLAHAIDHDPGDGDGMYRAIQGIPTVVDKVLAKAGTKLIEVRKGKHVGLYEPRTHHEYAWLVDAGLEALGDPRRMVAIRGVDWEEPLFVLATPDQVTAIENAKIEDEFNPIAMPQKVTQDKALADLAKTLELKLGKLAVKVDGDKLAIDLAKTAVEAFVDRLYSARFHDMLVGHRVERDHGPRRKKAKKK